MSAEELSLQPEPEKTLPTPWPQDTDRKMLVEHLKLIQAVIARQSQSAFIVKGWSVTTTGALIAFAALHLTIPALGFAGVISSGVCWFMDAHFLRFERSFRCLYQAAIDLRPVPPFSMDPGPWVDGQDTGLVRMIKRPTVVLTHLPMMLASVVVGIFSLVE